MVLTDPVHNSIFCIFIDVPEPRDRQRQVAMFLDDTPIKFRGQSDLNIKLATIVVALVHVQEETPTIL